mmetsp:Transcript_47940/g.74885  ORF Transcript_47940/g.74885 Transcript_47940/m.74885 type:complete len:201 (+) Transcript_47940:2355-2957(+)
MAFENLLSSTKNSCCAFSNLFCSSEVASFWFCNCSAIKPSNVPTSRDLLSSSFSALDTRFSMLSRSFCSDFNLFSWPAKLCSCFCVSFSSLLHCSATASYLAFQSSLEVSSDPISFLNPLASSCSFVTAECIFLISPCNFWLPWRSTCIFSSSSPFSFTALECCSCSSLFCFSAAESCSFSSLMFSLALSSFSCRASDTC